MSLQLRLTLAFAALLGALALAALFGLDALTRDMRGALGDTARSVGARVFTLVREEQAALVERQGVESPALHEVETITLRGPEQAADAELRHERIEVVVNGQRLDAEQIAALPETHPARRFLAHGEQRPGRALGLEFKPGEESEQMLWLHAADGRATGIPIPATRAEQAIEDFRQRLLWGLGLLLLAGLLGAAWLARRIALPLRDLALASDRLGRGELDQRVAPSGPPEVRRSLEAFNRMADDLSRLQAEAESLRADRELAELGEIGRGLAHSLRNPLHALGLSLEALAEGRGDGDAGRAAGLAGRGREQLARIDQALRGFLALSTSTGAQVTSVELDAVLDDVVLEASQRAPGKVRVERERCALGLPGVEAELRIILHALVINAVEASPDGGVVRIRARCDAPPDGLLIDIEDQGAGLSSAVRAQLFQPHVSSKPTGAGMGLYLAERLVRQRYHGTLQLDDLPEGGTRARLRLNPRDGGAGRA